MLHHQKQERPGSEPAKSNWSASITFNHQQDHDRDHSPIPLPPSIKDMVWHLYIPLPPTRPGPGCFQDLASFSARFKAFSLDFLAHGRMMDLQVIGVVTNRSPHGNRKTLQTSGFTNAPLVSQNMLKP